MESLQYSVPCTRVDGVCRSSLEIHELKASNNSSLLRIQEAMSVMDGKNYTLDEVQQRIIKFYTSHIPVYR